MPLEPGAQLAHYEIVTPIGAGGMGEVYRATDRQLGRDVAIKVLPEELASVPERLERFEREAKLLASLNHPNVATLYGLEREKEKPFLVMELVEGETLAERIGRGPIPFEEARSLFIQIAEGLEAAHERGIVHRDLKPANIKLTAHGKIKILDFGIAKAFAPDTGVSPESSQSPTLTKGTALGAILGTAAYMSPEQARGKLVDRRTDVWAFGCCLYEALTGQSAFSGETVPDILSAVLSQEPDWTKVPSSTPRPARRLLERALRKDTSRRLQHVGDARVELLDAEEEAAQPAHPTAAAPSYRRIAAAALLAAAAGFLLARVVEQPPTVRSPPTVRTTFELPEELELVVARGIDQRVGRYPPIAIDRDGRRIALVARGADDIARIYVRELDAPELTPLPGSENAELPFFSPDGRSVGFLVGSRVFKAPVAGGVATEIGNAPLGDARGAAWVRDDLIVLGGVNAALSTMNAVTGEVAPLTNLTDSPYVQHSWPTALVDGEHVLFNAWSNEQTSVAVASLSSGEWQIVEQTDRGSQANLLESGHLVFFRDGAIFAAMFDSETMSIEGDVTSLPLNDFVTGSVAGVRLGYFAVSTNGTLVLTRGTIDHEAHELVRVTRSGEATLLAAPRRFVYLPALSPDGERVAVADGRGLSLYDLRRGTRARLIADGIGPVWSAEGERVYYDWFPGGDAEMFSIAADGSGDTETVLARPYDQYSKDASPDGRLLVFRELHPNTGNDLHILPLDGGEPYPFLATPAAERDGAFSPDSRFLAYTSDETGRDEIYVQALEGGGRVPVSANGGFFPRWARDGSELFYRQGTTLMAVEVELEPTFSPGIPAPLFSGSYAEEFDVFPNGDFVMIRLPDPELRELELVVNWPTELSESMARW